MPNLGSRLSALHGLEIARQTQGERDMGTIAVGMGEGGSSVTILVFVMEAQLSASGSFDSLRR
jgi:hypothetical protein